MKKIVVILAGSILAALLSLSSVTYAKELSGPAKDFTLKSKSGKNIRLKDLRGQVVMLNFWASWCGPCKQEMPLLEKMYKRYNPAGFTLLGINVEASPKDAKALLKKIPVSFPILYDTKSKVSELYNVSAMPSTVLVDCDGNMTYLHKGYKPGDEKEYQRRVKGLLKRCK